MRNGIAGQLNPAQTVRAIVGTTNRATGQREGGIIGLTTQQTEWVLRAQSELTSGDPSQLAHYLTRKRRDRTFDRIVARAIRDGRPVSAADARKMTERYSQRLLPYRGEVISRTETLRSLHAAQQEGLRQMVESGKLAESQIKRTWDATGDKFTRDTHRHMEGQTVGLNEPFRTNTGALLMYPGDSSLGAPGAETIQCRCRVTIQIDYFARFRRGR